MWIGSVMIITRCLKIFTNSYPDQAQEGLDNFRIVIKKIYYGFCLPGALITLISGIYQFSLRGAAYYMKLGWFHGKLTLVLILFVVTFMLAQEIKKVTNKQILSKKKTISLHAVSSACMIIIVFLTILNR